MLRREEGFTLTELLVTTAISSIVIAGIAVFILTGYRTFDSISTVLAENEELSLARMALTEDIRSAYPDATPMCASPDATLTCASPDGRKLTLGVYAQATGFRVIEYEYLLATGELTRRVIPYSGLATPGPTANPSAQTLARKLARGYTSAIFLVDVVQSTVSASIPLPGRTAGEPARVFQISAAMRPQKP